MMMRTFPLFTTSRSTDDGVTVVQTVLVLAIIAVLVFFGIPIWGQFMERTRAQSCLSNQRTIIEAIELARTQGHAGGSVGYFDAVLEPGHDWGKVLIPEYLDKAPVCPVSGGLYNMSPLGAILSDRGAGQYSFVNQGLPNDHRLAQ